MSTTSKAGMGLANAVLLATTLPALAADVPMSRQEIVDAFVGRTAVWQATWAKFETTLAADGAAHLVYQAKGGPPSIQRGIWKIDDGRFCMDWGGGSAWCYNAVKDGSKIRVVTIGGPYNGNKQDVQFR